MAQLKQAGVPTHLLLQFPAQFQLLSNSSSCPRIVLAVLQHAADPLAFVLVLQRHALLSTRSFSFSNFALVELERKREKRIAS